MSGHPAPVTDSPSNASSGRSPDPRFRGSGTTVYLIAYPGSTPPALLANLRHNEVLHDTVVVVTVQTASIPGVP